MRCFIIDTLIGVFAIDETGTILNFIDFNDDYRKIIDFYNAIDNDFIVKEYQDFLKELNNSGFNEFIFDNKKLEILTNENLKYGTFFKKDSLEFKNFRFNLESQLKKNGINKTTDEILSTFKKVQEQRVKTKVSQAGEQDDIIIIQIIESLDIIKKSISLFSSRLREWYGLYFPELTDKLVEDNIILAKMVSILGDRDNFTIEKIKDHFNLKEQRVKMLQELAVQSMGANIDLTIIKSYANQIVSLDTYREELEEYLEKLMEGFAPNLNAIVGSLVGAKLVAKAGSLKKLAYMPASRIQLLGAEKALYRYLKTGEKQPKHGLIFQWNQIRGSKPWNRGKISRIISGKIGISAKLDYFKGDFIADVLSKDIEEKILEIEKKYPKPPLKRKESTRKAKPSKSQKKKKLKRLP